MTSVSTTRSSEHEAPSSFSGIIKDGLERGQECHPTPQLPVLPGLSAPGWPEGRCPGRGLAQGSTAYFQDPWFIINIKATEF